MELAGWTNFGGASRKFHFIPGDDEQSLCGKWLFLGKRVAHVLQEETGKASPDDCKTCRKRLDAKVKVI